MGWPNFTPACRKDIDRVLRSGRLTAYRANKVSGVGPTEGSQAYAFEREVEKAFKVKHCVAVSSGTAALHAGLLALGVSGKEVITSPYTFSATASAIILAGGTPRFADVDPHTFCLSKETVRPHVTKKTAAILHVNLFGHFPDLSGLRGLGVPLLEDACQSVGASRNGVFAGTYGLAGAYSFNGSKNIPTGEGGCLVTNSDKVADKARLVVNHGENFNSESVGLNYRMTELHACLARHGLKELESRNQRRRDLVAELERGIPAFKYDKHGFRSFYDASLDMTRVFYVYPFWLQNTNRLRFISRCAKRGLTVGAGYIQPPIHHYRVFKKYATRELPVVDELSSKTLCLLYDLTPDKPLSYARKVAKIIRESLE